MENSYSQLCLDYIKTAKNYADNVIFWRQEQRDVMQNFINVIQILHELSKNDNDKIERRFQRKLPKKIKKDAIREIKQRRPRTVNQFETKLKRQLRNVDKNYYQELLGLSDDIFNKLVNLIETDLRKVNTNFRNGIQAEEQLRITLRFLATGETYKSLQRNCGYSHSFTCITIPKVCRVLWDNLKDKYIRLPESHDEWKKIANTYEKKWQFPLCLGALDGQNIHITSSNRKETIKSKRNNTYSKILLGLADANYKFRYIHIGAKDLNHKNQVLKSSDLQAILENSEIHLPPDDVIGNNRLLPYVIVSDKNFIPQKHLLTPYHSDTLDPSIYYCYNQRFTMAKQTIDRTFNILTSRFHILKKPMKFRNIENVDIIIRACCILHNFFIDENVEDYKNILKKDVENDKNTSLEDLIEYDEEHESNYDWIRNQFLEYFNDEGEIEWMEGEDVI